MFSNIENEPPTQAEGFSEPVKFVRWEWKGDKKEREVWESFAGIKKERR